MLEKAGNSLKTLCLHWGEKIKPLLFLLYILESEICFKSLTYLSICQEMYFSFKPHAPGEITKHLIQLKRLKLEAVQLISPISAVGTESGPLESESLIVCNSLHLACARSAH